MQNELNLCNYCKSSCHKVALEFFATNAPNPPHWTEYSCFVAFRSVWVQLGPFRCFMILGLEQAELLQLMQKFVPQSRVKIFPTNPPDPNHRTINSCFGAFRSIWVHFGSFHKCMKVGAKHNELVHLIQKFVP